MDNLTLNSSCKSYKIFLITLVLMSFLLLVLLLVPSINSIGIAEGSYESGFRLISNQDQRIWGRCRLLFIDLPCCKVINPSKSYFVPTKTYKEFSSFTNAFSLKSLAISFLRDCNSCGDNEVQSPNDYNVNEQCDGSNLNGKACNSLGFDGGTLSCTSSCTFDTTQCYYDGGEEPPCVGDECGGGGGGGGGGGSGCFLKGTLIETPKGKIEITSLKAGDYVWSYDNNTNKVVKSKIDKLLIHESNTNWYYVIKTKNSKVEVTDVHPFYVGDGSYKKIEELNVGDYIYLNNKGIVEKEQILSKDKVQLDYFVTVYNLELDKNSPRNYFANGYLVHNGDNYTIFNTITGMPGMGAKE